LFCADARIKDDGILHLCLCLERNTALSSISLRYNFVTTEGVRAMTAAISDNPDSKMKHFDLSGNTEIAKDAQEQLMAALPMRVEEIDLAEKYGLRMGNVGWGAAGAAVIAINRSSKSEKTDGPYAMPKAAA